MATTEVWFGTLPFGDDRLPGAGWARRVDRRPIGVITPGKFGGSLAGQAGRTGPAAAPGRDGSGEGSDGNGDADGMRF